MSGVCGKPPVLSMEELGLRLGELGVDPVEELARYGARLVMASYLEAEVVELLGLGWYERGEGRRGYRNGHRRRKVTCGSGEIEIDYPKVRETSEPFRSGVLDAWQRRSQTVLGILPSLYLEGLSTRDVKRAMRPLWKESGLSRSSVSRANQQLKEAFHRWRRRDLSGEDVMYLVLDGHYQAVRFGVKGKEAVLVVYGYRRDGSAVLLGVWLGVRESKVSWKLALDDLVARGLKAPLLVVSDGNPGLIGAVKATWPEIHRQRCVVHRKHNVLERVPKGDRAVINRALNRIFYAPSLDEALQAAEEFANRYGDCYPSACEVLGTDLEDCLTFFRFPPRHWKRLRTSNSLERTFREVRRRTRVIGRFPTEMSALSLVWCVMDEQSDKWRGMRVTPAIIKAIEEGDRSLREKPIVIRGFEELLAA
jgi:putative transposase